MKSLKSLLALGVAMAVSATSFADTTNPFSTVKDAAKDAVTSQVSSAKSSATSAFSNKAATAKETLNTAKTSATDKVASMKMSATDKMSAVKTGATEKISAVKASAAEKATSVKASAAEKMTSVKTAATNAKNSVATKVASSSKVNINTADEKTLQSLSGIGEAKAKAIVEYRNRVGKIKSASELSNVSGIGSATIEKISPFLSF